MRAERISSTSFFLICCFSLRINSDGWLEVAIPHGDVYFTLPCCGCSLHLQGFLGRDFVCKFRTAQVFCPVYILCGLILAC